MKRFLLGALLLCPLISICQVTINYTYDIAGNRTAKSISTYKMEEILLRTDSTEILNNNGTSYYSSVSPNPTNEKIEIFSNELSLPFNYLLIDLSGKILINGQSSENFLIINLSGYMKGSYVLVLSDQFKKLKYKIIKF